MNSLTIIFLIFFFFKASDGGLIKRGQDVTSIGVNVTSGLRSAVVKGIVYIYRMKPILFFLTFIVTMPAIAQNEYRDDLLAFQDNYKKELFEIIKNDTAFVRFYEPDVRYRVLARVELLPSQSFFKMRASGNSSHKAKRFAKVYFTLNGKPYELFAYQLGFLLDRKDKQDDFFIPFTDEGSGKSSYEGGRYLDFKVSDIVDNKLIIDFNKAYNPYCAFTTGYKCPIPPVENTLPVEVAAGEKKFAKDH